MNLKRICQIFMIMASAAFYGCGNNRGNEVIEVKPVEGTPISVPKSFMGLIPLACHNDTIIFDSYSPDYNLQICTIRGSGLSVTDFVEKGSGPGQMMYCSATFDPNGDMLVVNTTNGWMGTLYRYADGKLTPLGDIRQGDKKDHLRAVFTTFAAESEYRVLFAGDYYIDPVTLFTEVDYRNGSVKQLDYWPEDGFEGSPYAKLGVYANSSKIYYNGNGLYVYTAYPETHMFIFSIEGDKISIKKWIYDTTIKYTERPDGLNYKLDVSPYRLDTFATPDMIYVLYKDKTKDGKESKERSLYGNTVEVYDWEGNMTAKYELDNIGTYIWVNDKNGRLYLMNVDFNTFGQKIWEYQLEK